VPDEPMPTITLNTGATMPALGAGVFRVDDAEPVVSAALEAGYRLIDTAASYDNEASVGRAIATSGLPRADLFVTSKLANSDQGYDATLRAFDASLERLGLDYLDLYLIHWPVPTRGRYVETWTAMAEIAASGRARAVGVSNFLPAHLQALQAGADLVPAVNQVELHPGYTRDDLRALHAQLGITTEAWSPLARGDALLARPDVQALAADVGCSPAQLVLRWHLDRGHVTVVKSVRPERMQQNLAALDVVLTDEHLRALDDLDGPGRVGPDPMTFDAH